MPHVVRLRPRSDGQQIVHQFSMQIDPKPTGWSELTELDGNAITRLWFTDLELESLKIHVTSEVETLGSNPFNYLLETWATHLPIHYPQMMALHLQPYLQGQYTQTIDPVAIALAQDIYHSVDRQVVPFLTTLNQRIHDECEYTVRETGEPFPAGITWQEKLGSCRDYAVLFVEACRAVGLAARFVSGYQKPDPDAKNLDLHAWAEVYLPGAGWRGFDPTNAVAVADHHVPLVATSHPRYASPVSGILRPGSHAQSNMDTQIKFEIIE